MKRLLCAAALLCCAACSREDRIALDTVEVKNDDGAVVGSIPFGAHAAVGGASLFGDAALVRVKAGAVDGYARADAFGAAPIASTEAWVVRVDAPVISPLPGDDGKPRIVRFVKLGQHVQIARDVKRAKDGAVLVVESGQPQGYVAADAVVAGGDAASAVAAMEKTLASMIEAGSLPTAEEVAAGILVADKTNAKASDALSALLRDRDWKRSQELAKVAAPSLKPMPSLQAKKEEAPAVGDKAYVLASVLKLRAEPSSKSKAIADLAIGTAVDVDGVEKDWVHGKLDEERSGWLARAFVSKEPPDGAAEAKAAEEARNAGNYDLALLHDQRAEALGAPSSIVKDALAAGRFGAAVDGARAIMARAAAAPPESDGNPDAGDVVRRRDAAPLKPAPYDVVVEVVWGCRGAPMAGTPVVEVASTDLALGSCAKSAGVARCAEGSFCKELHPEDQPADDVAARRALRAVLSGPWLHMRITRHADATTTGDDKWRTYRVDVTWAGAGGDFPGAWKSAGLAEEPLVVPALDAGASVELWKKLPGDKDAFYGVAWGDGAIFNRVQFDWDRTDDAINCESGGDVTACAKKLQRPPPAPAHWETDNLGRVCRETSCDMLAEEEKRPPP